MYQTGCFKFSYMFANFFFSKRKRERERGTEGGREKFFRLDQADMEVGIQQQSPTFMVWQPGWGGEERGTGPHNWQAGMHEHIHAALEQVIGWHACMQPD